MKVTQESRYFDLDNGDMVKLRIMHPSHAHGAWAGNPKLLRQWIVYGPSGNEPTKMQIIDLETELKEIDLDKYHFHNHPGLGLTLEPND